MQIMILQHQLLKLLKIISSFKDNKVPGPDNIAPKLLKLISTDVISLSKISDRDWSCTRHVICTNNHCWPVQRSTVPVSNSTSVICGWFLVRTLY